MNKKTFEKALNGIDPVYITEALNDQTPAPEKTARRTSLLKTAAAVLAACIVLTGIFPVFMNGRDALSPVPDAKDTAPGIGSEIDFPSSPVAEKPTVSSPYKIGLKYNSAYEGKTIAIDAYMLNDLSVFDPFVCDGFPYFQVYTNDAEGDPEHQVIINGRREIYGKELAADDLRSLASSISTPYIYNGHRETVVLDFNDFDVGEQVLIRFDYGYFFYRRKDALSAFSSSRWSAGSDYLHFSIEENGVTIGVICVANATGNGVPSPFRRDSDKSPAA